MQAYGNDYVYVNSMDVHVSDWPSLAIKVSDRHFGIGSDGLILICSSEKCDFGMRVFDPDGTECEMCGNALRSVSKYVYHYGLTDKTSLTIDTIGGIQYVDLIVEDGKVVNISADIGVPVFDKKAVPVECSGEELYDTPVEIEGRTFNMSSLSWGNPHTVMFIDDVDTLDITKYGPAIENHPMFPKRTNVTFAQVIDDKTIKMREWERGCGETIGCGTGCCTAAVFGNRLGYTGRSVTVEQIGGPLKIEWDENDHIHMTGWSEIVYEGVYEYEAE